MNKSDAGSGPSVRSVGRVLQILELFAATQKPARLTVIARALDLPKSSCSALLNTLRVKGYLYEVGGDVGYYPTRRWLDRASAISAADPIARWLRPVMESLHAQTGETVVVAQRVETSSCYVEVIESNQNIRYSAQVGECKPLHATASGKALLATMPAAERRSLLNRGPLQPLTPVTIVESELLEADLDRGRARGWYITEGETESDVTGVAVALQIGEESYAMVVAGPLYRMNSRIETIAAALQSAARDVAAL